MWLFQRERIQSDVFWQRRHSKMSYTLKNIFLSFKRLTKVRRSQNVMYKCSSLDRIKISSSYPEKSWKSNNPLDIGLVSWYQVSTSSFWMFTETFFQEKGTFYLLLNLYLGLEYDVIVWTADLPRECRTYCKIGVISTQPHLVSVRRILSGDFAVGFICNCLGSLSLTGEGTDHDICMWEFDEFGRCKWIC